MGRPRAAPAEARSARRLVWLTEEEAASVDAAAKTAGVSVSAWLRDAAGATLMTPTQRRLALAADRLAGEQAVTRGAINRVGVNLNQLMIALHGGKLSRLAVAALRKQLTDLNTLILKALTVPSARPR